MNDDEEKLRERHNALYLEANELAFSELPFHGMSMDIAEDDKVRQRLAKALGLYEEVVRIRPDNGTAMWAAGMTARRLGDWKYSLSLFERAIANSADQPINVRTEMFREACITATEMGEVEKSIRFAQEAIKCRPKEAGLISNLAIAYLFAEQPEKANEQVKKSLEMDRDDGITLTLRRLIEGVLAAKIPCPHNHKELNDAWKELDRLDGTESKAEV